MGAAYSGVTIRFVDGATGGGAQVSYNDTEKILTIRIDAGVTTAETVRQAVNTHGMFTAVHDEDDDSGAGIIDTASETIAVLHQMADINPDGSSSPANLTVYGTYLYFSATDGTAHGVELWRTDGGDPERVTDINTGGRWGSGLPDGV